MMASETSCRCTADSSIRLQSAMFFVNFCFLLFGGQKFESSTRHLMLKQNSKVTVLWQTDLICVDVFTTVN